ncbi:MAG: cytochrome bc complex cytochrome b subunit [Fimbriimonadales bacterium]
MAVDQKEMKPVQPGDPPQPDSMMDERPRLKDWLDLRLGWWGFVRKNLDEPMPPGVGWWQTLGNLIMTLLIFQFITGLVLAMYYSPSPSDAHASVQYASNEIQFGALVRGMHSWGASLIIMMLVLHLMRVFFWGSYKKPRELTWLVGVIILQVVLALSFTGYLLPWDQKAYWATVVGTNIAGTVPFIGGSLLVLIRGGHEVGALTLTRFYAGHTMLLPPLLFVLGALHMYLVRRHHIAPPPVPLKNGKTVAFFPTQLFRDGIVVVVGVAILSALVYFFPPKLEGVANPVATDFAPRPEWYFLGLFELLKVCPRGWEVLGTVVIPGIIGLGLMFLPWIDRSPSRRPVDRQWVIDLGIVIMVVIALFTFRGLVDVPAKASSTPAAPAAAPAAPGVAASTSP